MINDNQIDVIVVDGDIPPSYDEMGVPDSMRDKPLSVERALKIASKYDPFRDSPVSLQVALTDACFNSCVMCDHPSREKHMIRLGEWIDFMNWAVMVGEVESVCYSGGDPMAYPEFNAVMAWHVEYGVSFGITTSGYVPKNIDLSLLAKATWVRVSLDAVTPEVYDACRGRIKVDKVIEGIDSMLAAGVNVQLGVTVHSGNQHDIKNVMAFAKSRGITDGFVHTVYPDSVGDKSPLFDRQIKPFQYCSAVFYQLYIDSNGDVYPCCITAGDTKGAAQSKPLGNISNWKGAWIAAKRFARLHREELPRACKHCVKRLSEINHVIERLSEMQNQRAFF